MQRLTLKNGAREKQEHEKRAENEADVADDPKMQRKVMKQQNEMKSCSEWMIGGPRCL